MKQGKEKKEVLSHLANLSIGYSDEASQRIAGFLLGVGIVQRGEKFEISFGRNEFKHFYDWFYNLHSSKIKGKIVEIINKESNNQFVLCLTNIEDGRFLAYNGEDIRVYDCNEVCVNCEVTNVNVLDFYRMMHERGFSYDNEFFLTKKI